MQENNNYIQSGDNSPGKEKFLAEVLSGLRKSPKELPSKYFYDRKGSDLFEQICCLDEYYIPATEDAIMRANIQEMASLIGPNALIIEYGSGECRKVRFLLKHLDRPVAYVPIDISIEQLMRVSKELALDYPELEVLPLRADYTGNINIPETTREYTRTIAYFPGSTIGNFDPIPAKNFLEHIAQVCSPGGGLLIGVDLKKNPSVLHKAYNDGQKVTAAFNLNLLIRINRELGADFDLDSFTHYSFYNPKEGRVEMHLYSNHEQTVHLDGSAFFIDKGETIWSESSYKYNLDEFEEIAATAGFRVKGIWTDEENLFSVQYLETTEDSIITH
ncbi:L-histidine N(alpha)-methyltransferase [Chloroflexota bacterium]